MFYYRKKMLCSEGMEVLPNLSVVMISPGIYVSNHHIVGFEHSPRHLLVTSQ